MNEFCPFILWYGPGGDTSLKERNSLKQKIKLSRRLIGEPQMYPASCIPGRYSRFPIQFWKVTLNLCTVTLEFRGDLFIYLVINLFMYAVFSEFFMLLHTDRSLFRYLTLFWLEFWVHVFKYVVLAPVLCFVFLGIFFCTFLYLSNNLTWQFFVFWTQTHSLENVMKKVKLTKIQTWLDRQMCETDNMSSLLEPSIM